MSILTISRSQSRATQVRHPRSLSSFGRLAPQRLASLAKCLCACLLLVATAAPLSASTIELPLTQEYSGASPPAGSSPWLTVKFDDQNTPGSVVFTVEATNLTGTEFISGLYLNIDSSIDPADLSFGVPTKTGSFADPTISLATDSFNAAGGSKYDILLGFSKKSSDRFGVGEEVKYTLTGTGSASGLVALDFVALGTPNGSHGPFLAAAHVQSIGANGENSGWIAPVLGFIPQGDPVPEPSSMAILSLGFALVACRRRFL